MSLPVLTWTLVVCIKGLLVLCRGVSLGELGCSYVLFQSKPDPPILLLQSELSRICDYKRDFQRII